MISSKASLTFLATPFRNASLWPLFSSRHFLRNPPSSAAWFAIKYAPRLALHLRLALSLRCRQPRGHHHGRARERPVPGQRDGRWLRLDGGRRRRQRALAAEVRTRGHRREVPGDDDERVHAGDGVRPEGGAAGVGETQRLLEEPRPRHPEHGVYRRPHRLRPHAPLNDEIATRRFIFADTITPGANSHEGDQR